MLVTGCAEKTPHPGEQVWVNNCKVCHEVGLAGSPVFGDVNAWKKRIARGKASLYEHALNGWGDMPAKGGNPDLTDDEVKQAVEYMVINSQ
ncbi:cytochrome c5 family protein [Aliiglaciecola sp. M165]|nr:cytochrome c5 family protein [Aliiglaciecola sp. M165]